jgi:hypothetical protein
MTFNVCKSAVSYNGIRVVIGNTYDKDARLGYTNKWLT